MKKIKVRVFSNPLLEIALIFSVFLAFDLLVPDFEFWSLNPHPLWVPVVLASLQFGRLVGILTGLSAIIVYATLLGPERQLDQTVFEHSVLFWSLPALWLGCAFVLGSFRDRQLADIQVLQQKLDRFRKERGVVGQYLKDLEATVETLEMQAVLKKPQAGDIRLEAFATLRSINYRDPSGARFHDAVNAILGECSVRLYLLNTLEPRVLTTRHKAGGSSSAQQDVESAWEEVDQLPFARAQSSVQAGSSAASQYIRNPRNGELLGVLEVHGLSPINRADEQAILLDIIAGSIARAIDQQMPVPAPCCRPGRHLELVT